MILEKIKEKAPQAYYYAYQAYAHKTDLYYQTNIIQSETGVQQGDPLGPALFALGVQELATKMKSQLNVWYLDDATLGGDAGTVLSDFRVLIEESTCLGLSLNKDKCEIVMVNPDDGAASVIDTFKTLAPEIQITCTEDVTLLGATLLYASIPRALQKSKIKIFIERKQST